MDASRHLWDEGHLLQSGRVLYESMKDDQRVKWAANILWLCTDRVNSVPEINQLLECASDPRQWKQCHQVFQQIRAITLETEKNPEQHSQEFRALLDVAETTAKILYNASHETAPFDYHAGWRLPLQVKKIMDVLQDQAFHEEALQVMFTVPASDTV